MEKDFQYIKESEFARRNHMLETFSDSELSKAISKSDFDQKYGTDHEVFTMDGINKFVEAATKEGATNELVKSIENEFTSLSKIIVKGEDGQFSTLYVREKIEKGETNEEESVEEGEESSTEESTEETSTEEGSEASTEEETEEVE